MQRWVNPEEWTYGSEWLNTRQHHPDGNMQNLNQVFQHFEIPNECSGYTYANISTNCSYINSSKEFIDDFAYIFQVFQAVSIQMESEHYRRFRSQIKGDGRGLTMCALFWQINDVWAAPTWASIDFDLNWKVLQYYSRKFFAPLIVSAYYDGIHMSDKPQLNIFVVSDLQQPLYNYTLLLDVFTWERGFTPLYTTSRLVSVPALNATILSDIPADLIAKNVSLDDNDGFVLRARLFDSNMSQITPTTILLPNNLRQISNYYYGGVTIQSVTPIVNVCTQGEECYPRFSVTLAATQLVPPVWIDIVPNVKETNQLLFWFDDNGFTITEPQHSIELTIFSTNNSNIMFTIQDFTIKRLKMGNNTNITPSNASTCPVNWHTSTVHQQNCYGMNTVQLSWANSRYACTNTVGSDLSSIDSAFENNDVTSFISKTTSICPQTFIGLIKSGNDWKWANNDASTYRNWRNGYPTNDPNANCAALNANDGTWTNVDCGNPNCYICELTL